MRRTSYESRDTRDGFAVVFFREEKELVEATLDEFGNTRALVSLHWLCLQYFVVPWGWI